MLSLNTILLTASATAGTAEGHGATGSFETSIELPKIANESTHFIATALMDLVKFILQLFGLDHNPNMVTFLYVVTVIVVAFLIGAMVKWILIFLVDKISRHSSNPVLLEMRRANFFNKCSRLIPPLVILLLMQFAFANESLLITLLYKSVWIYIAIVTAMTINALVVVIWIHIDSRENKKRLPLQGIVQVVRTCVWIMAVIVIVCILINKSPATLLAGLGAFAAVLMLVFKDSILGLVAGVQLAENDMLREGDWIVVGGTNANGTVTEVNLTSVKVLNWDKTITTVPPYTLVSQSFTNYRNMSDSNTRQIQRLYYIDADSVRALSESELEELKSIPLLKDYIEAKQRQAAEGKVQNVFNSEKLVDGTIETNLGLFRAYLKLYLDRNENISHRDICFIKTAQQTAAGIPLQVYCFTNTSAWASYEAIQSGIFEHIALMMPRFSLYVFENPSGRDTVNEGYLEASSDPNLVYGLPYPFMKDMESYRSIGRDPLMAPAKPAAPAPAKPADSADPAAKN